MTGYLLRSGQGRQRDLVLVLAPDEEGGVYGRDPMVIDGARGGERMPPVRVFSGDGWG